MRLVPQEQVQRRTPEHFAGVPVPRERVQHGIEEQIVEVPTPQISEDIVGEFKSAPQEQGRPCPAG